MRTQLFRLLSQRPENFLPQSHRSLSAVSDTRKSPGSPLREKEQGKSVGSVQKSIMPPLSSPNTDFISFIFRNLDKWHDKVFNECGITGRKYTYGQTFEGALRWGAAVKKLLPRVRNPTVASLSVNSPDNILMIFGTIAAGGVGTPISAMNTPGEIAFQLKDSGADMLVVDSFLEPLAEQALKHIGKDIPVILNGSPTQSGRPVAQELFLNPKAPKLESIDVDPQSISLLLYSSGTTGKPKGAMLTHEGLVNNALMYATEGISGSRPAIGDHQDVQIGILPHFHVAGIVGTVIYGANHGIKTITLPKFDPETFVPALKKNKITVLQAVPSLVKFLNKCPAITSRDLDRLGVVSVGAAPVSEDVAIGLKEKAPSAIFQEAFGMTETMITHITPTKEERIGFCGVLLSDVEAKILDTETGEMLPPNVPGEMLLRTPSVMAGYLNNDDATRATIDEEGWLRTGDIALYTEDGFFSIVDRVKDLIKVKGSQVAPAEVEETIQLHPGVLEAGVIGVPHPRFGEAPLAYIVKEDPNLTEEAIHCHAQHHLSPHKQLAGGVKFVTELPKNATGKVLRKVLREMTRDS